MSCQDTDQITEAITQLVNEVARLREQVTKLTEQQLYANVISGYELDYCPRTDLARVAQTLRRQLHETEPS